MTPEERGYIAGLLDGEGCIRVCRTGQPTKYALRRSPDYRLHVSISNTERAVLEWLQTVMGLGHIYTSNSRQRRPCYSWTIIGDHAVRFLQDIRGLLRIKATRAWLALEFAAQCTPYAGVHGMSDGRGTTGRSAEETALREGYYLAMRMLNGSDV